LFIAVRGFGGAGWQVGREREAARRAASSPAPLARGAARGATGKAATTTTTTTTAAAAAAAAASGGHTADEYVGHMEAKLAAHQVRGWVLSVWGGRKPNTVSS
jgi:hypothetical protein